MAKNSKQQSAAVDEELPVDQHDPSDSHADDLPPADPAIASAEEAIHNGMIHALQNTTDELHAIQMRLAEMQPLMAGAIAKAKGNVKTWLQALHDSL